jgi:integration host factor subunit alpha
MTLTRKAITHSVSSLLDLPRAKAAKAVETTFEIIKKTLKGGEDALINGVEKLCVREERKRRSRNPGSGEQLMVARASLWNHRPD